MTSPFVPVQSSTGGSLTPSVISGNITAASGFLYYVDSPSIVSIQLPATAANGDRWGVINSGNAPVRVTQAAGQRVIVGDAATTTGITGRLTSSVQGDWLEFYYSTSWIAEIKSGFVEVS